MHTLEELSRMNKSQLMKLASSTNDNETHLSLVDNILSSKENSYHVGGKAKKQAVAKKPAAKPKKRLPVPPSEEDSDVSDWEQDGCKDDKVKNPVTKKCVKKCEDGKVRNKTTGRCVNQKGKKTKKSAEGLQDLPVEEVVYDSDDGDWAQDDCKDGKVKNPVTKNCVKACEDGKVRNKTTGRCVNQKGKKVKKSAEGLPDLPVEEDKRDDLTGLGITKLKEIAKKLKLTKFSAYKNNAQDIQELRLRIEDKQVQMFGQKQEVVNLPHEEEHVEIQHREEEMPPHAEEQHEEIQHREEEIPQRAEEEQVEIQHREEEMPPRSEEHVEIPLSLMSILSDQCEEKYCTEQPRYGPRDSEKTVRCSVHKNVGDVLFCDPEAKLDCENDDVCFVDDSGKGKCQGKGDDVFGLYETMTVNGKNVIGNRQSLSLLGKKLGISEVTKPLPPIAPDEDITSILKELSDAPSDVDVLSDPSIKELIRCLFKR